MDELGNSQEPGTVLWEDNKEPGTVLWEDNKACIILAEDEGST
jgi:hypothetical protein